MALEAHIESLQSHRAALKAAIRAERTRPAPDEQQIHAWQKENLRLKDRVASLYEQSKTVH